MTPRGIARFRGEERFTEDVEQSLRTLLENIGRAVADLESVDKNDPRIEIFQRSYDAIERLIAAEGDYESVLQGEPAPPFLDDWAIVEDGINFPRLEGLSFGHPRLTGSARPIHTSLLLYISPGQSYARTLSRWYRLGRKRGEALSFQALAEVLDVDVETAIKIQQEVFGATHYLGGRNASLDDVDLPDEVKNRIRQYLKLPPGKQETQR